MLECLYWFFFSQLYTMALGVDCLKFGCFFLFFLVLNNTGFGPYPCFCANASLKKYNAVHSCWYAPINFSLKLHNHPRFGFCLNLVFIFSSHQHWLSRTWVLSLYLCQWHEPLHPHQLLWPHRWQTWHWCWKCAGLGKRLLPVNGFVPFLLIFLKPSHNYKDNEKNFISAYSIYGYLNDQLFFHNLVLLSVQQCMLGNPCKLNLHSIRQKSRVCKDHP